MSKKETPIDSEDKILIVLYRDGDGKQTWSGYFGGAEEANQESALMEETGYHEVGRIPSIVETRESYRAAPVEVRKNG